MQNPSASNDAASSPQRHSELLKQLREDLEARGFFNPTWFWTINLIVWIPLFFAIFYTLQTLPFGLTWAVFAVASGFGVLHFGYVGHDAGHYGLSKRPWVNDFWGQISMSAICGMSFGFWRPRHNEHHVHCQEQVGDPDMQFGVLLSVYPDSASWKSALGRVFLRIQRYSFWPLTSFYWVTLRYDGIRDLFQRPAETRRDRFFIPFHYIFMIIAPCILFGVKVALINYVVVSMISSVFTAAVFVPNHIGLRSLVPGERLSYLEQQITTSRNISNPRVLDFFYGGLNSQIEHHIFPRVPHHRLRRMRPIVREFCRVNGLTYHEEGLFSSLAAVTRHLGRMTDAFRARQTAEPAAIEASERSAA